MTEQWRDIPGFEGYYQASNLCRVRSIRMGEPRIMHNKQKGSGYAVRVNHKCYYLSINRIMDTTWPEINRKKFKPNTKQCKGCEYFCSKGDYSMCCYMFRTEKRRRWNRETGECYERKERGKALSGAGAEAGQNHRKQDDRAQAMA